jgi:hypothetical protein
VDSFKQTIRNKSWYQDSNDNDVRIVNFATSNHRVVKNTVFPHRNIHKYIWTSPGAKTHNQTDHELVDRDGILAYSMYSPSGDLTLKLVTIWCLQESGKNWR